MSEKKLLLTTEGAFKCKVSSTLQPAALYSSKNMFDYSTNDSCWNSDQGSPQFILFDFLKPVNIQEIDFVFQGGFVGQEGFIEIGDSTNSLSKITDIHTLLDNNEKQKISLNNSANQLARYMKITFPTSTDFYGRITLYSLEVYGIEI